MVNPFKVPIKEGIVKVSSGGHNSMAITENGEVYAFGCNKKGKINSEIK